MSDCTLSLIVLQTIKKGKGWSLLTNATELRCSALLKTIHGAQWENFTSRYFTNFAKLLARHWHDMASYMVLQAAAAGDVTCCPPHVRIE